VVAVVVVEVAVVPIEESTPHPCQLQADMAVPCSVHLSSGKRTAACRLPVCDRRLVFWACLGIRARVCGWDGCRV
jgi:hypothetical protein